MTMDLGTTNGNKETHGNAFPTLIKGNGITLSIK